MLTALARPLMSSAITVEITIEPNDSKARKPMAMAVRVKSESRSVRWTAGKKRFMPGHSKG
jgi:hypothetical protein